jgi:alanyl-tRNA synthetase
VCSSDLYDNVGFHLGARDSTLDFNGELTATQLKQLELQANKAVVENLDIIQTFPTKKEADEMEFRSKIELDEGLRIIIIPEYDKCACCAPQLKKTGEIGIIKLTNVQKHKGGVRVTMLCGFRALEDYNNKEASVKCISTLLSAEENQVVEAVQSAKDEIQNWKQKNNELTQKLIKYKVKETLEDVSGKISKEVYEEISKEISKEAFEEIKGICVFEDDLEGESPRYLVNALLDEGVECCAVFSPDSKINSAESFRYVIGSKSLDVRSIGKMLNERFDGRGGGKENMVQGSIKGDRHEIKEWFNEMII